MNHTTEEFLQWLRDRLVHIYKESPNVDFVRRLDTIVDWHRTNHMRYNIWDGITTHQYTGSREAINHLAKLLESDPALRGTLTPPSTTTAPSSESASSATLTSSEQPEDILLEALKVLKKLPDSYGWSLTMASGPLNCTFEVSRPSAATDSARSLGPNARRDQEEIEALFRP
jgi:hypothetical protein